MTVEESCMDVRLENTTLYTQVQRTTDTKKDRLSALRSKPSPCIGYTVGKSAVEE
jgi:hypothetical protein